VPAALSGRPMRRGCSNWRQFIARPRLGGERLAAGSNPAHSALMLALRTTWP
jgi:hypothetical protein